MNLVQYMLKLAAGGDESIYDPSKSTYTPPAAPAFLPAGGKGDLPAAQHTPGASPIVKGEGGKMVTKNVADAAPAKKPPAKPAS